MENSNSVNPHSQNPDLQVLLLYMQTNAERNHFDRRKKVYQALMITLIFLLKLRVL